MTTSAPFSNTTTPESILHFEREGRVALLTLNRPEKLNAINYALADALLEALDAIEADDELRAVVITGAGNRAFSAGGDIAEFSESVQRGPQVALREFVKRGQAMTSRIEAFSKPIIAAVNGIAYGGGCEITEATHLAIASFNARFAKPEILLEMPPTFGGTQRLPRLAGRKRALELLLTGESFDAERAYALGLVNRVVPPQELLPAAKALAGEITTRSQEAVASILHAVTRGVNTTISEGLDIEAQQFARMAETDKLQSGLQRWLTRTRSDTGTATAPLSEQS